MEESGGTIGVKGQCITEASEIHGGAEGSRGPGRVMCSEGQGEAGGLKSLS